MTEHYLGHEARIYKLGQVATITVQGDFIMGTLKDEGMLFWAGLDVGKDCFDASVAGPGFVLAHSGANLRELPVRRFARSYKGAGEFLAWVRGLVDTEANGVRVVMEATGWYSTELTGWLLKLDRSLEPAIVNPKYTSDFIKSLGVRNKTDQLEARGLALYGRDRRPRAYQPPSKALAKLRELARYREFVVAQRAEARVRSQQPCGMAVLARMQAQMLARMGREEARLVKMMRAVVAKDKALARDVQLLMSIYGVGFLTAAVVLAEAGDLRRFEHARQLTAYAGLTPQLLQSGTSLHTSRLSKQGNARLRRALYMAALTTISQDNDLGLYYRQLVAQGKRHKSAMVAVARKLLVLMRALLISGQEWRSNNTDGGKLGEVPVQKAA